MLGPGFAASLLRGGTTHSFKLASCASTPKIGFPSTSWCNSTYTHASRIASSTSRLPHSINNSSIWQSSHRLITTSNNLSARLPPSSSSGTRRRDAFRSPRSTPPPSSSSSTSIEEQEAEVFFSQLPPPPSGAQIPSISRTLFFFLGFSALTFTGAAYYSLRDTEHIASELRASRDVFANISSFFSSSSSSSRVPDAGSKNVWGEGVTEKRLMVAKNHEVATRLGMQMQWLVGWCQQLGLPTGVTEFVGRSYIMVAEGYLELSESKQMVVPIVAVNSVVFVLWTIASARRGGSGSGSVGAGRLWNWMNANFLHRPSTNSLRTMMTSVFSHQTFLHFLFNNMALWSIGGSALIVASHQLSSSPSFSSSLFSSSKDAEGFIGEASHTPHFLAFFITAGLFASTVSHVVAAIRFRRIASLLSLDIAKSTVGRQASLGSSGAVYSLLVMSALAYPDAKLGILFLPFISFPIGVGVAGLVAMDVTGILLRWRLFDHWAHLGGALFGWVYWNGVGEQAWETVKSWLVNTFGIGLVGSTKEAQVVAA